jgi:hypothetical protein
MKLNNAILVLDKGFVYFGNMCISDGWVTITNAHNIRSFGTKRGLGQLSLTGPTSETVLDPCNTIICREDKLIHIIEAVPEVWAKIKQ